ncbi:MAG: O-antigen ligase family protein [Nostoc sp. ChiQUE02]|uniref:O-antigen ligase family protein n=1 Tax=Nostoc sp. ChiQUE02 TaxID=3075377 RepID=UPI002AD47331|nr:O-antigen ligase family protein [Nostoc sp. ChiQUE02]MDZ8235526.1 O-antigen ligase family protein [Nostoc sp. ChiQUE02]
MNLSINKKHNLLFYYQCALAVGAILTFFTEISSYLYTSGIFSRPPLFWIVFFGLASIPLLFSNIKYISRSVITWCFGFIFVSLLWFVLLSIPAEIAVEELKKRILSVIFILINILIFSCNKNIHYLTRWAIFITVLMAVFNNIYEFFNPIAFNSLGTGGRSAGFYLNPNSDGAALVLGMIFSVSLLQPIYRLPFVSIIGIGVLLTFSRGAILGWLVTVIIFTITSILNLHKLLYWVLGIGTVIISFGSQWSEEILQNFSLNQNSLERIAWFQNISTSDSEDSADSRLEVAQLAWELFTKHPFFGNGIGSTLTWNMEISTHNIYLYYMADHGILGAFILPLLVYAVTQHAHGETKYIGLAFAAFILLWGLFSHNVLEERYILIMFSLIAAMTAASQLEQRFKVGNSS